MNDLPNKWIEISSSISLIFVFTGLLSIFRCFGEFRKGNVETADYGLCALILLLSTLLLCIGLILLYVTLKSSNWIIGKMRKNQKHVNFYGCTGIHMNIASGGMTGQLLVE